MIIAVTGTPGTGKSKSSALFAKKIGHKRVDLNRKIRQNKLFSSYDRLRDTYVADMRKVRKFVKNLAKSKPDIVIDSHVSHELGADMVIVLRCRPEELVKRLRNRRWSRRKIEENVEAEFIGIISHEARKRHKKVWEIDTSDLTPEKVADIMAGIFEGRGKKYAKEVNWLRTKGLKGWVR